MGKPVNSWRVVDLPYRVACDLCGLSVVSARAESRSDDVRFVCPWHKLPDDMPKEPRDTKGKT